MAMLHMYMSWCLADNILEIYLPFIRLCSIVW
eukprot:UN23418